MLVKQLDKNLYLRSEPTASTVSLLCNTTLGSKGAKYRLLDIIERIHELDNPLYLTLERNQRTIANMTLCQREKHWYLRYFSFDQRFQTKTKSTQNNPHESHFHNLIDAFFEDIFNGTYGAAPAYIYAYIDPTNDRSVSIANRFDFQQIATILSQTFSRSNPKEQLVIEEIDSAKLIEIKKLASCEKYHSLTHYQKHAKHFTTTKNGEIIAYAMVKMAHWKIERLPGVFGGMLSKSIQFIPILRKLISPKNHSFACIESVYVKNNDPKLLQDFLETICAKEQLNLLMWWVDECDPTWKLTQNYIRWGLLNKLTGVSKVSLVSKSLNQRNDFDEGIYHVNCADLI